MKIRIPIATTTAAFVAVSTTALASGQSANSSNQNTGQNQSQVDHSRSGPRHDQTPGRQGQNAKAPEGFVLLEENTLYMMAREPQQHLLRAHEQLQANNPKA